MATPHGAGRRRPEGRVMNPVGRKAQVPLLLSKKATAELAGFHPEHVMRLARAGQFPQPIKLGGAVNCAVRFVAEEVDAWIAARMADRKLLGYEQEQRL